MTDTRTAMTPHVRDVLENGTQTGSLAKMMTRAELYDALGYTGYESRDRE